MAEAWYLRKLSFPLGDRSAKLYPRGYPPINASGNTISWDPSAAASFKNLSALSAPKITLQELTIHDLESKLIG